MLADGSKSLEQHRCLQGEAALALLSVTRARCGRGIVVLPKVMAAAIPAYT